MKVGQAYNAITKALITATSGIEIETEKQMGSNHSKGKTHTVESLHDLYESTSTSSSLSATFGDFGISSDVNTKHTQSVDQRKVYVLSQITAIQYSTVQKAGTSPTLTERAKDVLGLRPPAVKIAEAALADAKQNLEKSRQVLAEKENSFQKATAEQKTAQAEMSAATEAYELISRTAREYNADPIQPKKFSEQVIQALQKKNEANDKLQKADALLREMHTQHGTAQEVLGRAEETHKNIISELSQAKSIATEQLNNPQDDDGKTERLRKLKAFFKLFGTNHVVQVDSGRSFDALSTFSREAFTSDSKVSVGAGATFANVGELKTKVDREKRENKKQYNFTCSIQTRGVEGKIPQSVDTAEELEKAIADYYNADKTTDSADIHFKVARYDSAFHEAGLSQDVTNLFYENVEKAEKAIKQLLFLQKKAIRALVTRDFYLTTKLAVASTSSDVPLALSENLHTHRLDYLYSQLQAIIYLINRQIKKAQNNPFDNDYLTQLIEETAPHEALGQQIDAIINELKTRANKGLIYAGYHVIANQSWTNIFKPQYRSDSFKLANPAGTTQLYFATYAGGAQVTVPEENLTTAEQARHVSVPKTEVDHEGWARDIGAENWALPALSAPTTATQNTIKWAGEGNRLLQLNLKQQRDFGVDRKHFKLRNGQQAYALHKNFDGWGHPYYLHRWKGATAAGDLPVNTTVQIYATKPRASLGLELVDANVSKDLENVFNSMLRPQPALPEKTTWHLFKRAQQEPQQVQQAAKQQQMVI